MRLKRHMVLLFISGPPMLIRIRLARLVTAKSKVAPLKKRTIPELELSGAVLLADMLENISSILDIPKSEVVAWTDSTIVICWLRNSPSQI